MSVHWSKPVTIISPHVKTLEEKTDSLIKNYKAEGYPEDLAIVKVYSIMGLDRNTFVTDPPFFHCRYLYSYLQNDESPAIAELSFQYPGPESNRHEQSSSVFETDASTNSATGANWSAKVIIFVTPQNYDNRFFESNLSGLLIPWTRSI